MSKYDYKRILRFLVVGSSNALLHFIILNITFFFLGQTKIVSSIIATCFAVTYSFFLNRNYVFRPQKDGAISKYAIRFIIVTLLGMLLVHNAVFAVSISYLEGPGLQIGATLKDLLGGIVSTDFININLATVLGAIVAMIWNYNGYRLFVFKDSKSRKK